MLIDLLVPHLSGSIGPKLAPVFLLAGLGGGLVVYPQRHVHPGRGRPGPGGSGGGMLQTAQRVGSAIGVAVILAQFFARLGQTGGDYAGALVALCDHVWALSWWRCSSPCWTCSGAGPGSG